jgi:phage tail-like protein
VSPTTRVLGRRRPPTVVLTRGNDSSMALWEWHDAAVRGNWGAARKNCSLIMYNYEGKLIARYHLDQAWPAKLELHGIKAGAGERLTETVTIVCDNIHRMVP